MSWEDDAAAHARREAPREACGLVVRVDGVDQYRPCRNLAQSGQDFELCPRDYAAAEDAGELIAVFHSHPLGAAAPSLADINGQRASGLPWIILGADGAWWIEHAA